MNPGFHIDQLVLHGIASGAWQGNKQPSQTLPIRVHPLSFIGILKGLLHCPPLQGIAGGNSLHNCGLHWTAPAHTPIEVTQRDDRIYQVMMDLSPRFALQPRFLPRWWAML